MPKIYKDKKWRNICAISDKHYLVLGDNLEEVKGVLPECSQLSKEIVVGSLWVKKARSYYGWIVATKTGNPYSFLTESEAVKFAESRKNGSVYTIYHSGKSIAAYVRGEKLDKGRLVYATSIRKPTDVELDGFNYTREKLSEYIYKYSDKVKATSEYVVKMRGCDGKVYVKKENESLTFCEDGKVYVYKNNAVKCSIDRGICLSPKTVEALLSWLLVTKRWPDWMKEAIRDYINDSFAFKTDLIVQVWARPNATFVIDTYKKTCNKRESCVYKTIALGIPRSIIDESKIIDEIASKYKLKTSKAIKKEFEIAQDVNNVLHVKRLQDAGFADVNNILKLKDVSLKMDELTRREREKFITFIRTMIGTRGENNTTKLLKEQELSDIVDASRIALSYDIGEQIVEYIIKNSRNLHEMHESILKYSLNEHNTCFNKKFSYSKEDRKLEGKYKDVEFKLPIDSKELAIVGAEMGICVGSYAGAVLSGYTRIIVIVSNGKYVACAEMKGERLVQLKGKFNNPVSADYKSEIDRWIKEKKIKIDCSDYSMIGFACNRTYRYDRIDPNQIVDHNEKTLEIVRAEVRMKGSNLTDNENHYYNNGFRQVEDDELPF